MTSHESSMQSGAAILAGIGILPSNVPPLTRNILIDRELILSVSDGFTRQSWVKDGRKPSNSSSVAACWAEEIAAPMAKVRAACALGEAVLADVGNSRQSGWKLRLVML